MERGRVRWYNKHLGYGFITHWDGRDTFVHHSVLTEDVEVLQENQIVEYECENNEGRLKATNVKLYTLPEDGKIRRRFSYRKRY